MSQDKHAVNSETAITDISYVVDSPKAGEPIAEAGQGVSSQEDSVENCEDERGDLLNLNATTASGDGDAPPSSQNLAERSPQSGVDNMQSQPNNLKSPVDVDTICVTEEAQHRNSDKTDVEMQSDVDMQSDAAQLEVTEPVTGSPEDSAVDTTNNAGTDDMETEVEKPITEDMVAETSEEMSSMTESHETSPPILIAKEMACKSPAGGAVAGPCQPHNSASPEHYLYQVKWIHFNRSNVGIITQNENGPCPLLAIVNILTLQGKIKLPPTLEVVSSSQLMEYLADCVFEQTLPEGQDNAVQDYEQNRHDALAIFHKLQTGLDVNVKFSGVADFEYTPECIVFDLLSIRLVHGWLVDHELPDEVAAIGSLSYNQLVEKIIIQKNSSRPELVTEALLAEEFLDKTAAQLTYCGLCELASTVHEEELCVFFRNNHFSTLHKHNCELFLLVTDQGYLTESKAVWETLGNVEGDGHFVDAEFHTYTKPSLPAISQMISSDISVSSDQQIDQDYLVALSLQEDQTTVTQTRDTWQPDFDSDHALAQRLQEEEDSQAGVAADIGYQQQQQQEPARRPPAYQTRGHSVPGSSSPGWGNNATPTRERKKEQSCTIL